MLAGVSTSAASAFLPGGGRKAHATSTAGTLGGNSRFSGPRGRTFQAFLTRCGRRGARVYLRMQQKSGRCEVTLSVQQELAACGEETDRLRREQVERARCEADAALFAG